MDSFPPAHGPARDLDDVLADLGAEGAGGAEGGGGAEGAGTGAPADGAPPELPEVVQAVTGRARDLHRLADRLGAEPPADGGDGTLSAVALLRAHAGAVDDLAEHLLAAGAARPDPEQAPEADARTEPGPASGPRAATYGPRGVG